MSNHEEREAFGRRLQQALRAAGEQPESPTAIARAFNRRYAGNPVSQHAVRKWVLGESIPNQDKLRVLAEWLQCTAEWLRFGGETPPGQIRANVLPGIDYSLMRAIAALTPAHRQVVDELVRALAKAEQS